jgi:hypothetical protein
MPVSGLAAICWDRFQERDNKENIVTLFDWDNVKVKELEKLTAASKSRNTLVD